jgi:hypothetical protein
MIEGLNGPPSQVSAGWIEQIIDDLLDPGSFG